MISLLDILLLCRLVFRQGPQQALAAAQNVTVRPVKVIRIPRIFNVALPLGKVQQQMQLRLAAPSGTGHAASSSAPTPCR